MDQFVHDVVDGRPHPAMRKNVRHLLSYVERVTQAPWKLREADVRQLREAGLSDRAVHDAVQIAAYFNYINRVADALGVDLEPGLRQWGQGSR